MLTLKQWMELVDYRVTEGSDWFCNVPGLYSLTSWNGDHDGHSSNIVFDPADNQRVYLVEICDYKNNRAYCISNANEAGVKIETDRQAWDDVNYINLDVDEDFIEKAEAIIAGENYDTRVKIPVEFSDEELLKYMKMAHDQDITFNEFVGRALTQEFKQLARQQEINEALEQAASGG